MIARLELNELQCDYGDRDRLTKKRILNMRDAQPSNSQCSNMMKVISEERDIHMTLNIRNLTYDGTHNSSERFNTSHVWL